jgi:hypothetical protein
MRETDCRDRIDEKSTVESNSPERRRCEKDETGRWNVDDRGDGRRGDFTQYPTTLPALFKGPEICTHPATLTDPFE